MCTHLRSLDQLKIQDCCQKSLRTTDVIKATFMTTVYKPVICNPKGLGITIKKGRFLQVS